MDLDLDYFVTREEAPYNQPELSGSARRAAWRSIESTRAWLCELTRYCTDIISERRYRAPELRVTPGKVRERLLDVRNTLRSLLPSTPCLVTIARSNEGSFTPLNATMAIEDALLEMLRGVYGAEVVGQVQYLRSAFSSREQSLRVYARLEEEGRLVGPRGAKR